MKILMVCLGNICRSPIAEGLLREKTKSLGWTIRLAATQSFHVGEGANPNSVKICKEYNLDISQHKAQIFTPTDLDEYDVVYVMATDVKTQVLRQAKTPLQRAKVQVITYVLYPDANLSVKDPYYGTYRDFRDVYILLDELTDAIVKKYTSSESDEVHHLNQT